MMYHDHVDDGQAEVGLRIAWSATHAFIVGGPNLTFHDRTLGPKGGDWLDLLHRRSMLTYQPITWVNTLDAAAWVDRMTARRFGP